MHQISWRATNNPISKLTNWLKIHLYQAWEQHTNLGAKLNSKPSMLCSEASLHWCGVGLPLPLPQKKHPQLGHGGGEVR